ncbi:MAG: tetratricopeptide repeat protein [Planctomycetota bacterium]|nr:tetratricopeptide repeat protein [Planctomycetota bacterium]
MVAICACMSTLVIVGTVLFPVVTADFANRDDSTYVYETAGIWNWSSDAARLAFNRVHYPSDTGGYYQPLVDLSYMLDARLTRDSRAQAFFFHLDNLGIHLLNVTLVFILVLRLGRSVAWSVLLSLAFGLHPIQVESVAWISQRMTLLGTMFSLAATVCYVRYATDRRVAGLLCALALYAAALLSKTTFLALPVAFLLLDYWPLNRLARPAILEKGPFVLLMLAAIVVRLAVGSQATGGPPAELGWTALVVLNISSFAQRLAWPFALSPLYPISASDGPGLGDFVIVLFAIAAVVLALRGVRPLFVAIAGMAAFVLPAMVHLPFTSRLLGDQYLYPAFIMPILVVAAWMSSRGPSTLPAKSAAVGLAVLIFAFGAVSHRDTSVWRDGEHFFHRVVETHPRWVPGYAGLVDWHLRRGDHDQALVWARKARAADLDSALGQFCLGTALLPDAERNKESIRLLRSALRSRPEWVACLQNLGAALTRDGRPGEAIEYLERARDLSPKSWDIRTGLGYAYLKSDRPADARREFTLARKRSNDPRIQFGLAMAWAENEGTRAHEYARRHLEAAVGLDKRLAIHAARNPALRRLASEFGIESLFDTTDGSDGGDSPEWDIPTAGTQQL